MSYELLFFSLMWMYIVWYVYICFSVQCSACCKCVDLVTVMYLSWFTGTIYLLPSAIVSQCWWSLIVPLLSKCCWTTLKKYRFVISMLLELSDICVCRKTYLQLFWLLVCTDKFYGCHHDLQTMQDKIADLDWLQISTLPLKIYCIMWAFFEVV